MYGKNMDKIVNFSGLLRKNGIPVSIRSTCTSQQVLELIGEKDPHFKEALASVYIKENKDRNTFNRLYDEFFQDHPDNDGNETDNEESSKTSTKSVWSAKSQKNGKFPSKKMNLTIKHTKSSQMRSTTIHPLTIIVKLQMRLNFSPEILIP